jgi:hypothetical protein
MNLPSAKALIREVLPFDFQYCYIFYIGGGPSSLFFGEAERRTKGNNALFSNVEFG